MAQSQQAGLKWNVEMFVFFGPIHYIHDCISSVYNTVVSHTGHKLYPPGERNPFEKNDIWDLTLL